MSSRAEQELIKAVVERARRQGEQRATTRLFAALGQQVFGAVAPATLKALPTPAPASVEPYEEDDESGALPPEGDGAMSPPEPPAASPGGGGQEPDPHQALMLTILDYAIEAREAGEEPDPLVIQSLTELVHDPDQLAEVLGAPPPTVHKSYWALIEKAGIPKSELDNKAEGQVWQSASGVWSTKKNGRRVPAKDPTKAAEAPAQKQSGSQTAESPAGGNAAGAKGAKPTAPGGPNAPGSPNQKGPLKPGTKTKFGRVVSALGSRKNQAEPALGVGAAGDIHPEWNERARRGEAPESNYEGRAMEAKRFRERFSSGQMSAEDFDAAAKHVGTLSIAQLRAARLALGASFNGAKRLPHMQAALKEFAERRAAELRAEQGQQQTPEQGAGQSQAAPVAPAAPGGDEEVYDPRQDPGHELYTPDVPTESPAKVPSQGVSTQRRRSSRRTFKMGEQAGLMDAAKQLIADAASGDRKLSVQGLGRANAALVNASQKTAAKGSVPSKPVAPEPAQATPAPVTGTRPTKPRAGSKPRPEAPPEQSVPGKMSPKQAGDTIRDAVAKGKPGEAPAPTGDPKTSGVERAKWAKNDGGKWLHTLTPEQRDDIRSVTAQAKVGRRIYPPKWLHRDELPLMNDVVGAGHVRPEEMFSRVPVDLESNAPVATPDNAPVELADEEEVASQQQATPAPAAKGKGKVPVNRATAALQQAQAKTAPEPVAAAEQPTTAPTPTPAKTGKPPVLNVPVPDEAKQFPLAPKRGATPAPAPAAPAQTPEATPAQQPTSTPQGQDARIPGPLHDLASAAHAGEDVLNKTATSAYAPEKLIKREGGHSNTSDAISAALAGDHGPEVREVVGRALDAFHNGGGGSNEEKFARIGRALASAGYGMPQGEGESPSQPTDVPVASPGASAESAIGRRPRTKLAGVSVGGVPDQLGAAPTSGANAAYLRATRTPAPSAEAAADIKGRRKPGVVSVGRVPGQVGAAPSAASNVTRGPVANTPETPANVATEPVAAPEQAPEANAPATPAPKQRGLRDAVKSPKPAPAPAPSPASTESAPPVNRATQAMQEKLAAAKQPQQAPGKSGSAQIHDMKDLPASERSRLASKWSMARSEGEKAEVLATAQRQHDAAKAKAKATAPAAAATPTSSAAVAAPTAESLAPKIGPTGKNVPVPTPAATGESTPEEKELDSLTGLSRANREFFKNSVRNAKDPAVRDRMMQMARDEHTERQGKRASQGGADAGAKPTEQAKPARHESHQRLKDAIEASPGLTDEHKQQYHEAVDRAMKHVPKTAHDRIAKHMQSAQFHPHTEAVVGGVMDDPSVSAAAKAKLKGKRAGGAFINSSGALHIDGAEGTAKAGRHSGGAHPHEVYAHELGHAIDGPNHEISKSPEWADAFKSEIATGAKGADSPLTEYGATKPSEGLAEFSRLVYGSDVPHSQIAKEFPKATQLFKDRGLWPDKERTGPEAEMAEAFDKDKRVELGKDGSHADVLLDKPAEQTAPAAPAKEQPKESAHYASKERQAQLDAQAKKVAGKATAPGAAATSAGDVAEHAKRAVADPGVAKELMERLGNKRTNRDDVVKAAHAIGGDQLAAKVKGTGKRAEQLSHIEDYLGHSDVHLMRDDVPEGASDDPVEKTPEEVFSRSDVRRGLRVTGDGPGQKNQFYGSPSEIRDHFHALAAKHGLHPHELDAAAVSHAWDAVNNNDAFSGANKDNGYDVGTMTHNAYAGALESLREQRDDESDADRSKRFADSYFQPHGDEEDSAASRARRYIAASSDGHSYYEGGIDPTHMDEESRQNIANDLSELPPEELGRHILHTHTEFPSGSAHHDIAVEAAQAAADRTGDVTHPELAGDNPHESHALLRSDEFQSHEWDAIQHAAKLLPGAARTRADGSLLVEHGSPLADAIKEHYGDGYLNDLSDQGHAQHLFDALTTRHQIPQDQVPQSAKDYGGESGHLKGDAPDDFDPHHADVYKRISPDHYVLRRSNSSPEVANGEKEQFEMLHRSQVPPTSNLPDHYWQGFDTSEENDPVASQQVEAKRQKATKSGSQQKRDIKEHTAAIGKTKRGIDKLRAKWHAAHEHIPEDDRPDEPDWEGSMDDDILKGKFEHYKFRDGKVQKVNENAFSDRDEHDAALKELREDYDAHHANLAKEVEQDIAHSHEHHGTPQEYRARQRAAKSQVAAHKEKIASLRDKLRALKARGDVVAGNNGIGAGHRQELTALDEGEEGGQHGYHATYGHHARGEDPDHDEFPEHAEHAQNADDALDEAASSEAPDPDDYDQDDWDAHDDIDEGLLEHDSDDHENYDSHEEHAESLGEHAEELEQHIAEMEPRIAAMEHARNHAPGYHAAAKKWAHEQADRYDAYSEHAARAAFAISKRHGTPASQTHEMRAALAARETAKRLRAIANR